MTMPTNPGRLNALELLIVIALDRALLTTRLISFRRVVMNKGVVASIVALLVLLVGVIPAGAEESEQPTVKAESKDKAPVKEAVKAKAPARETKSSDCPPRPTPTPTVSKTATPTTPPTSPQPPAEVEYSDWYDVSWDCEVQLVTRTRTRAETPYVWDGSNWVLDRANTRYSEEIGTRPMTSSELLDCGPPLPPEPSPTPTPTPSPEPTPTPDPTPSPTPTPTPEPTPTVTPSLNSARPGLPKTGN